MTLAAIAFGAAALIVSGGFVHDLYRQLGEAIIHSQSGHLQVAQPALFAQGSRSPEKHRIADVGGIKAQIARLPGVEQVTARLSFVGLLNNGRTDLPIIGEGMEPDNEARFSSSMVMLSGRQLRNSDRSGALLGEGLAKALGVRAGDPITLVASTVDGAMNTADLEVVGVFRSFSKDYDARAIKIPLAVAQDLLATPDANTVVVLLHDTADTQSLLDKVRQVMAARGLEVRDWQQLNDFYANTIQLYDRQFTVLTIIILFMVGLGVTNAVNMAVFERLGEFGTMRALGNRGAQVVRLIMTESVLLGLFGASLGIALGVTLALAISMVGIPMPPPPNSNIGYTARIALVPRVIVEAAAVALVATVAAGIIPSLRARRIAIVDALRQAV